MSKPNLDKINKTIKTKAPEVAKEFKEFINRGSVMDLAIGVIIGGAFSSIVTSLVDNIIMPIVSIFIGGIDFSHLYITVPSFLSSKTPATINIGLFLQSVVDFIIVAFVIFLIVRALNKLREKTTAEEKKKEQAKEDAKEKQEDENTKLLREIRDELKKK